MQPPPPSTRIGPGEIVDGKFRVERVLGVGGMGFVVAARQIGLERRVALKFVRASQCDPEALVRFMREARATVRLRSEHVARILDVATLSTAPTSFGPLDTPAVGMPYIVMEYLEGKDLAAVLRERGRLSVGDAVGYVLQACEAIAEAHAHGIVHRDLKPENLFLTSRVDGRPLVKVLDFGISKLTSGAESGPDAVSLTRTEDLVGSPNYMSPEQLRAARRADARSDLWSLGVILYELIAGVVPFQARSIMQLCALVIEAEPAPLVSVRPDVPIALSDAVMRCLRKDPALRFASVAELAHAIEPFAAGAEPGAAARLRGIATATPQRLADLPARPPSAPHSGAATNVSWAETQRGSSAPPSRSRAPLAWIAASVAAALVTLFALVALVFASRQALRAEGGRATAEPLRAPSELPPVADAGPR
jgi:serine/threonine-protein kinase